MNEWNTCVASLYDDALCEGKNLFAKKKEKEETSTHQFSLNKQANKLFLYLFLCKMKISLYLKFKQCFRRNLNGNEWLLRDCLIASKKGALDIFSSLCFLVIIILIYLFIIRVIAFLERLSLLFFFLVRKQARKQIGHTVNVVRSS